MYQMRRGGSWTDIQRRIKPEPLDTRQQGDVELGSSKGKQRTSSKRRQRAVYRDDAGDVARLSQSVIISKRSKEYVTKGGEAVVRYK